MTKIVHFLSVAILIVVLIGILYFFGIYYTSLSDENRNQTTINSTALSSLPEDNLPHVIRTMGPVFVNATVFVRADTLPVYNGTFEENGSINLQLQPIFADRHNVTTEKDAPVVAKRVMEQYGGLPDNAVYDGASTSFDETINVTLGQVIARVPAFTTVFYHQQINGMQVIGDSNSIVLTLGTDGELLRIVKEWRNYTYAGDAPIIPVEQAIDKLERGELIDSSWHPELGDITIDAIGLGYYAKNIGNSDTQLEPVWMMFGAGKTGPRIPFYVYARKFANFSASPTTATPAEEITFRDLSDASPTRWFWDFGDGTNSTRKHVSHVYSIPGTYDVTLTVWNDMGSDTCVKKNFIIIQKSGRASVPSGSGSQTIKSESA